MRSVFLNNRARRIAVQTIDDDTSEEESFIAKQLEGNFKAHDIKQFWDEEDFELSAQAYIHCFSQLEDEEQIEWYAQLFQKLQLMQLATEIRLLLKYSTKNSASLYLGSILELLPAYLQSEDIIVKRRCYKLVYNIFLDYQDVIEGEQFNQMVEQQMLADMAQCGARTIHRLLVQVERARVLAGCTTGESVVHIIRAYIECEDLLKYVNLLATSAIECDDSGAFVVAYRAELEQVISATVSRLWAAPLPHALFEAFLLLLTAFFLKTGRTDAKLLSALLETVLHTNDTTVAGQYLAFLDKQLDKVPLIQVVENFSLQEICSIMGFLHNPALQEVTLDVFLRLETSYEPQWQWFADVCAADIKNENMAYSVAIILEDFLDQDEAFWPLMREHWQRVTAQLDPYPDQADFVENVLQGFEIRGL